MATISEAQQLQSSKTATVLVVEDDRYLNLALVETLQAHGYTVISAHNGREALDLLEDHLPDVIICDINMPVMDGYTFLQHTRAEPRWRLLPFIFLTARTATEDQRLAKAIGVEDYLSKPIDSRDLVAAIENALKRQRLIADEIERSMNNLRNRIVGLLQHEFRTPLTFILGYAELIINNESDMLDVAEMRLAANAILDGGRRLQQQIENFLFLAEIQNHALDPEAVELVNAWSLWNDILRDLAAAEHLGPLPVDLCDQNNGISVKVDIRLIDEAVRQLFHYVQRTRRADATRIECRVEHHFPFVGLAIHCNSAEPPPLPPEEHLEMFFARGATPAEVDMDLGLTLAQNVASVHGGRLAIDHGDKHAITFTLWLPGAEES